MMANLSIIANSSINQTPDQFFDIFKIILKLIFQIQRIKVKENKENSSVLSCTFTSSIKTLIGSNIPFLTRLIYAFTFVCEIPLSRLMEAFIASWHSLYC